MAMSCKAEQPIKENEKPEWLIMAEHNDLPTFIELRKNEWRKQVSAVKL